MRALKSLERRLAGKRAFVTGGGAGIGRSLCRLLAQRGWTVAVADIDPAAAARVADAVRAAGGVGVPVTLDVGDADAFAAAADAFMQAHGGVDLLINNAGIGDVHPFEATEPAMLARIARVNQFGVAHGCRAFLPTMRRRAWRPTPLPRPRRSR